MSRLNPKLALAHANPAAQTPAAVERASTASLKDIVNNQLQRGHYVEGEKALRLYLAQHPGDPPAQDLLRQLTGDPLQMLGRGYTSYVVQQGDSYSSLAARYLGDSGRFLLLARYNGSTDPARLRAGETLHLPISASVALPSGHGAPIAPINEVKHDSVSAPGEGAALPGESTAAKAARLQRESVTLQEQGQHGDALSRLDQALSLDPALKPSGVVAMALRKQLIANDHQQAIVLYRDQHLDQAIALWDRVLAIDPGFEPATIYRARALELQRRLKQL